MGGSGKCEGHGAAPAPAYRGAQTYRIAGPMRFLISLPTHTRGGICHGLRFDGGDREDAAPRLTDIPLMACRRGAIIAGELTRGKRRISACEAAPCAAWFRRHN